MEEPTTPPLPETETEIVIQAEAVIGESTTATAAATTAAAAKELETNLVTLELQFKDSFDFNIADFKTIFKNIETVENNKINSSQTSTAQNNITHNTKDTLNKDDYVIYLSNTSSQFDHWYNHIGQIKSIINNKDGSSSYYVDFLFKLMITSSDIKKLTDLEKKDVANSVYIPVDHKCFSKITETMQAKINSFQKGGSSEKETKGKPKGKTEGKGKGKGKGKGRGKGKGKGRGKLETNTRKYSNKGENNHTKKRVAHKNYNGTKTNRINLFN